MRIVIPEIRLFSKLKTYLEAPLSGVNLNDKIGYMDLFQIFNNRELAIIVWVTLLFIWTFATQPTFYKNIVAFLQSVVGLLKYLSPMFVYVFLCVFILYKLHFWDISLLKVTAIWFFGWAIVMFVNATKIGRENGYLKKVILELVGVTAVISFVSNFYSFSLWFELLLIPFVVLLSGMSALASFDKKHEVVGKFTNSILVGVGLIVLCVSLYKTVVNFNSFATVGTLQEFMIPILLSFMYVPYAYGLSIYSRWEQKKIRDSFTKKSTS